MHASLPLITTFALAFVLALVFGYVAERLKSPPLVGYLFAGIAVGPYTWGPVADLWLASQLSEIGVMLLMFGVGLHFSVRDLLRVKWVAVPGAILQMTIATALGFVFAFYGLNWTVAGALVFGLSLSCASTVVLLKALELRGKLNSYDGQIAVGWLVVEDIATVVILVMLPPIAEILGISGSEPMGAQAILLKIVETLLRVVAFIALMLLVGRKLIPLGLQMVIKTGSRELFTLAVLACAIGIAFVASSIFEVSFALGAFFAGVVMQESKFAKRAAADSLSFQDAFAVLFFVGVGMMLDWHVLIEEPLTVLSVLLIIMVGKSIVAIVLVDTLRYPLHSSLTIGASLAQIGEFSYILAAQGISLKMVGSEMMSLIVAASILSIALNPCMFAAVDPFGKFLQKHFLWARKAALRENPHEEQKPAESEPPGQIVVQCNDHTTHRLALEFVRAGFPVVGIAADQSEAERLRTDQLSAVVGKVTDRATLAEANVDVAKAVVLSGLHFVDGSDAIEKIRELNQDVLIIVRTGSEEDRKHFDEETTANMVLMDDQMIAEYMTASVRERCASRIIIAQ
ncbi:MAG TPA: sodium:proton antiporter [Sutterella sp.]|nr:sodium:proton antiporter [Sutterella sp.]